jgi:hypothetical protein
MMVIVRSLGRGNLFSKHILKERRPDNEQAKQRGLGDRFAYTGLLILIQR